MARWWTLDVVSAAVAGIGVFAGPSARAESIDSDINISQFATPPNVQFPSAYYPKSTDTNRWQAYFASGSVWGQGVGYGNGSNGNVGNPWVGTGAPHTQGENAITTFTSGPSNVVDDFYNIFGMVTATLSGTFKSHEQGSNNPGQWNGPALLSMSLGNGVGVAVESVFNGHWNTDQTSSGLPVGNNTYHYALVEYGNSSSENVRVLKDLGQWSSSGTVSSTASNPYQTASLTLTNNGDGTDAVNLVWANDATKNYTNPSLASLPQGVTTIRQEATLASWGQGIPEQPSNGGGNTTISFTDIHLVASDTLPAPEPASLGVIGIGALGLLTRRRHA